MKHGGRPLKLIVRAAMRRVLYLATLLAALINPCSAASDQRSFSLVTDPGFVVQATAHGSVRLTQKCVCFTIDSLTLSLNTAVREPIPIISVRLGIASHTSGKEWRVLGYATGHFVGSKLAPAGTLEMPPFETDMRRPSDLSPDSWVVLQIVMGDPAQDRLIYAFAHENGRP